MVNEDYEAGRADAMKVFCINCDKKVNYQMTTSITSATSSNSNTIYMYPTLSAVCEECHQEIYVPWINDVNAQINLTMRTGKNQIKLENRVRPIDAYALLEHQHYNPFATGQMVVAVNDILLAPIIHAYWIDGYDDNGIQIDYDCSNCNQANDSKTNYCPNCGALMDEGEINND